MGALLAQEGKESSKSRGSSPSYIDISSGSDSQRLRKTLVYLAKMRKEGVISEKNYEVLSSYVCSRLISKEVDKRVQNYLKTRIFTRLRV